MREVVLDTETTGLDPLTGDRIIEIGCVELMNHVPTGRVFQTYVDPERSIPAISTEVTGITDETVAGQPIFAQVADALLEFIADDPLVIHNAGFDLGFLNAEFGKIGRPALPPTRAHDTLMIARRKYPGAPASLDALCRRFNIDTSERVKHGALVDARLLAAVYLELIGGRQPALLLAEAVAVFSASPGAQVQHRPRMEPLASRLSAAELAAHTAFVAEELGSRALWLRLAA